MSLNQHSSYYGVGISLYFGKTDDF
jgi:hypothetical protein